MLAYRHLKKLLFGFGLWVIPLAVGKVAKRLPLRSV